jgi:hypothetical protein
MEDRGWRDEYIMHHEESNRSKENNMGKEKKGIAQIVRNCMHVYQ